LTQHRRSRTLQVPFIKCLVRLKDNPAAQPRVTVTSMPITASVDTTEVDQLLFHSP
jgi:hypothetical protein